MIRNYIIYIFNCAWRYLDRHGGNPTVSVCSARLAAEFSPFLSLPPLPSPRHQQSSHTYIHFRPYLHTLYTDSIGYCTVL